MPCVLQQYITYCPAPEVLPQASEFWCLYICLVNRTLFLKQSSINPKSCSQFTRGRMTHAGDKHEQLLSDFEPLKGNPEKKIKKSYGVQYIFPWINRNTNTLQKHISSDANEMQIVVYFFVLEDEIHELCIFWKKKICENNINYFFL